MSSNATILVVDDDEPILILMKSLLREFAYQAVTARSGEQALALARERRPDLVLLDLNMPGMGGPALIRELRDCGLADVPVLILSGDRLSHDQVTSAGAVAAIQKPFELEDLLSTIRRHLS